MTDWKKVSIDLCVLSYFPNLGEKNQSRYKHNQGGGGGGRKKRSSRMVHKPSTFQQTQMHFVSDFYQRKEMPPSLNFWITD